MRALSPLFVVGLLLLVASIRAGGADIDLRCLVSELGARLAQILTFKVCVQGS
jgi:hypothetical protein